MLWMELVLGLALLGFGGDILVKGAVRVAQKLKISPLLIGIVLVGFGTSTPELITTFMAIFQTPPATGLAVGNIIGSNIVNILLVLGLTAAISPVLVNKKSFRRDGIFLALSGLLLAFCLILGIINFWMGLVMVATLIGYVTYSYFQERELPQALDKDAYTGPTLHAICTTILGIAMTLLGARWLVNSSVAIATMFGVSDTIIGLTVIAVGTSLPEIATSIIASIQHHNEIAFGNIVGSNIYNALFILGFVALFRPIQIPANLEISFAIMAAATLGMLLFGRMGRISRIAGVILLLCYGGYLYWLI
ncbi:MAG: sodium:calcium antiporter [Proteobacteria bacterium]|nr:sodium:calcium antiporter [Candidatus Enterousia scatequi]